MAAVAVDSSNNIYIAGTFAGSMTIGTATLTSSGGDDIFVAKLAATGSPIWAHAFGGPGNESVATAVLGATSFLVGGTYTQSPTFGSYTLTSGQGLGAYLASIGSSTGSVAWVHERPSVSGESNYVNAVAAAGTTIYIATSIQSAQISRSLRRLNNSGSELSSLQIAPTVVAIDTAANGDLLVAGSFTAGSGTIAGGPTMANAGSTDGFVARLSPTLAHVWSTGFGSSSGDAANTVAEASDGSIVVAGRCAGPFQFGQSQIPHQGGNDAMVLSLTSGGIPTQGTSFGGTGTDTLEALALDGNDDIVAVGWSDGGLTIGSDTLPGGGGHDALVVKLSPTLVPTWSRLEGGLDYQRVLDVGVDALGRVAIGGLFRETLDFGTLLTSVGNTDAFLIQLSP